MKLQEHNTEYEDLMQQLLNNLNVFNLKKQNREISMIQFLIRYKQKVINKLPNKKNSMELVQIVKAVKNLDSPIDKINVIIDLNG